MLKLCFWRSFKKTFGYHSKLKENYFLRERLTYTAQKLKDKLIFCEYEANTIYSLLKKKEIAEHFQAPKCYGVCFLCMKFHLSKTQLESFVKKIDSINSFVL